MIDMIKACGYRVFMRKLGDEYCYYTDGTRIAYAQWSRREFLVSSVHHPSLRVGTGFRVDDCITPESLEAALKCHAPDWASSSDRAAVKKYTDWEAFHKKDKWNSELFEV